MLLNPVVYIEKIVRGFLRYQLTAYPFADQRLLQAVERVTAKLTSAAAQGR